MNSKQILFLTTTNLAANPRLTKELKLALMQGFHATVIQFRLGNWSDVKTRELELAFTGVKFISISALRNPFIPWISSSLLEKFCRILPLQFLNEYFLSIAVSKRTYLLVNEIRKIKHEFSWVIAHNPGAFYPASVAAKKTGALLGIDIEDYHPGETNDVVANIRMTLLMQRIIPKAAYCSFAAPLIRERFVQELRELPVAQLIILNGFEESHFLVPEDHRQSPLKCVWFSQFIDSGRGLENVLPIVHALFPEVELHLVGYLKDEFRDQYIQQNKGVVVHASMKQKELHHFLSEFDVGLAIEPGRDINNQVAVSNKIIAFAQAGLFILASHTPAQDKFLADSKLEFVQTDLSTEHFQKTLQSLIRRKEQIRANRVLRFQQGRVYDWEKLSIQLVEEWNKKN